MTQEFNYECQCWGCKAPQILPEFVREMLSTAHFTVHIAKPTWRDVMGRLYVFRDTPDNVVDAVADFDEQENPDFVRMAKEERALRIRRYSLEESVARIQD